MVEEDAIIRTVLEPEHVSRAHTGRWVAHRGLSDQHILRVIYEELPRERLVITFYPVRRSRYELTHDV